jgi:hypothetical protein
MITSVKKYGSYLLSNVTPYSQDIADDSSEPNFISTCTIPSSWTELSLLSITPYNHDTSIFRFTLPPRAQRLNLPIGGFVLVLAPGREHDGSDAVRPYTSVSDDEIQNNPATTKEEFIPSFNILCKRYDQWGIPENSHNNFLFTKTNHSYRPPGAVSNYLHSLQVGEKVKFKHNSHCLGKIPYPFPGVKKLMMIAVGAGIAPMIQILRSLFKDYEKTLSSSCSNDLEMNDIEIDLADYSEEIKGGIYGPPIDIKGYENNSNNQELPHINQIVLFYGVVSFPCYYDVSFF